MILSLRYRNRLNDFALCEFYGIVVVAVAAVYHHLSNASLATVNWKNIYPNANWWWFHAIERSTCKLNEEKKKWTKHQEVDSCRRIYISHLVGDVFISIYQTNYDDTHTHTPHASLLHILRSCRRSRSTENRVNSWRCANTFHQFSKRRHFAICYGVVIKSTLTTTTTKNVMDRIESGKETKERSEKIKCAQRQKTCWKVQQHALHSTRNHAFI